MSNRSPDGFRFGLEAEFLLVDAASFRPLWHPDLNFEKLNAALEAIPVGDSGRIEHGRMLVQQHHCGFCHNADFSGHDNIPRIAAQREDYLIKALREYKNATRPGLRLVRSGNRNWRSLRALRA
jgi:hypothetical protein